MEKTIRMQVLGLLNQGLSRKEIAKKLNISVHTVKSYIISLARENNLKNISDNK